MAHSRRNMLVQSHHPIQHGCFLFILLFSSIISINIRACNSILSSPPPFDRSDQAPELFEITAKHGIRAFIRVPTAPGNTPGNTAGGGLDVI
ncbi:hypothetical protein Pyn_35750 [Prunus yedoensis var. nudiflora]|uniref:Uncharacterized protein n=1 Tax=Prunus yedoensis var. nudiflora TaxID=2094558 RepID=A0A314YSD2_PRUYE|nr:hypothetical protein Pyn_35750 [Prunus yedoensis var. nudiflora]